MEESLELEAVHLLEDQEAHEVLRHVVPSLAADAGKGWLVEPREDTEIL